jgi:hypothetical protein
MHPMSLRGSSSSLPSIKNSVSPVVYENSSRINNEIKKKHLSDVTDCLMVQQTECKEGFWMQFKKTEVIDVVVLSSLKTGRVGISL